MLGGYCGQISLGHALYFGLGGYTSTMLLLNVGLPPVFGMLVGGLVGGLGALLVGWPCFRLSGHYYAVATVVVGEIGYLLFINWDAVGGASGLTVPIAGRSWLFLQFGTSKLPWIYITLAFAAVAWIVAYLVEGSRWGYSWRAVKDDVTAARSLAVRVFRSKMAAAAISGFLTGVGGAIYAQYVGYIDPDSILAGSFSILIALPAVLGRGRHAVGAAAGVGRADPGLGAVALLSRLLGQRRRPHDLRRPDRGGVAGAPRRPRQPVRGSPARGGAVAWLSSWKSRDLSKRFGGVQANADISFDVRRGEILGLIGPNGAGKTSLFNAISGEVVPDKGEIRLDGRRISGRGPVAASRAGVARTFQVVRSFDSMTVLENVMVGAFTRAATARDAMRRAEAVIDVAGLSARIDVPALSLTPPEKRRLEIARALATEPRVLLLDEMLTGLTPAEAQGGVQLIRDLRHRGMTIVMVEHVMEVLLPLIDRAVVLNLGRVLTTGLPGEVVRDPEVIRAYLGDKYVAA